MCGVWCGCVWRGVCGVGGGTCWSHQPAVAPWSYLATCRQTGSGHCTVCGTVGSHWADMLPMHTIYTTVYMVHDTAAACCVMRSICADAEAAAAAYGLRGAEAAVPFALGATGTHAGYLRIGCSTPHTPHSVLLHARTDACLVGTACRRVSESEGDVRACVRSAASTSSRVLQPVGSVAHRPQIPV